MSTYFYVSHTTLNNKNRFISGALHEINISKDIYRRVFKKVGKTESIKMAISLNIYEIKLYSTSCNFCV